VVDDNKPRADSPALPAEETRMILLASRELIEERGFDGDHLGWPHSTAVDETKKLAVDLFLIRAKAYFDLWDKQGAPYEQYCAWMRTPAIESEVTEAVRDLWAGHGGFVFQICMLSLRSELKNVIKQCCARARDEELARLQRQPVVDSPKPIALPLMLYRADGETKIARNEEEREALIAEGWSKEPVTQKATWPVNPKTGRRIWKPEIDQCMENNEIETDEELVRQLVSVGVKKIGVDTVRSIRYGRDRHGPDTEKDVMRGIDAINARK
jgi:hypothetical protein